MWADVPVLLHTMFATTEQPTRSFSPAVLVEDYSNQQMEETPGSGKVRRMLCLPFRPLHRTRGPDTRIPGTMEQERLSREILFRWNPMKEMDYSNQQITGIHGRNWLHQILALWASSTARKILSTRF